MERSGREAPEVFQNEYPATFNLEETRRLGVDIDRMGSADAFLSEKVRDCWRLLE